MPSDQDRAHGLIEDSLKDKNPDTRKHAVQALGLVSPREPYLSELEAMLDDKDVEVRLATITSLMDLKNDRTISVLPSGRLPGRARVRLPRCRPTRIEPAV